MKGQVKNLVNGKYFGFLRDADNNEYFFHREDFSGHWEDLVEDWAGGKNSHIEVEFEIVQNPKGPRAANVRRTDHPNQAV